MKGSRNYNTEPVRISPRKGSLSAEMDHDDSLLEDEDTNFDMQNEIYQLRSECNELRC